RCGKGIGQTRGRTDRDGSRRRDPVELLRTPRKEEEENDEEQGNATCPQPDATRRGARGDRKRARTRPEIAARTAEHPAPAAHPKSEHCRQGPHTHLCQRRSRGGESV